MKRELTTERIRHRIVTLCHSGLDTRSLLQESLSQLQRAVPSDGYFCGTVDPATLLNTSTVKQGMPVWVTPLLLYNEYLQDDVNKFPSLARGPHHARTLYAVTGGKPERSVRFRDIFVPMGFGDELRAVFKAGGETWGVLCLHRELDRTGFTEEETALLAELAPHLGEGIRTSLLLSNIDESEPETGPGLLLLNDDLELVGTTASGESWLSDIGDWAQSAELPEAVLYAAARLQALERQGTSAPGTMPRARVHTRGGRWIIVHAARLAPGEAGQIAIILEPARPVEVTPLLLAAYGLTARETQVAQQVLQGLATQAIAAGLYISSLTVQQHLKAVFEKVGVRSRREFVARVFAEQYQPRLEAKEHIGDNGWFSPRGQST